MIKIIGIFTKEFIVDEIVVASKGKSIMD